MTGQNTTVGGISLPFQRGKNHCTSPITEQDTGRPILEIEDTGKCFQAPMTRTFFALPVWM